MTVQNSENWKRTGFLLAGFIIGIVIMTINPYSNIYLGKTAYQWQAEYNKEAEYNNKTKSIYNDFINCLYALNKYTNYYDGTAYYVSDVNDINQCIQDNQHNLQDFTDQQQQDIIDQKMEDNQLGQ